MVDLNVLPDSFPRECGGWLAVSPPSALFKIGTFGGTKDEAVQRFIFAWQAWSANYDAGRQRDG